MYVLFTWDGEIVICSPVISEKKNMLPIEF